MSSSSKSSCDQSDTEKPPNGKFLSTVTALEEGVDAAVAKRDAERSDKLHEILLPIQRFSPEILSEIFILLSETIEIPPRLTQTPWILGRVCSQWRTLSRRDIRLWGHPTIEANDIEDLECAFDILPPAVNIELDCFGMEDLEDLYPYLNRCRVIKFYGVIAYINEICRDAPTNAFQNLATFHFTIHPSWSHAENSDLGSMSPRGLHSATQLEELELEMRMVDGFTLKSLMSLNIPRGQLKVIKIRLNVDIPALCSFLRQCYSVKKLSVELCGSDMPPSKYDNSLYLPELRELRVSGTNLASWITTLRGRWENLRYFNLGSGMCSADRLHEILEQCASLEYLRFIVPPKFPLRHLAMPVLRFMDASYRNPAGPFNNFFVPALEYLRIYVACKSDLDISTLSDMFERSQCPLSGFTFEDLHWPIRTMPFLHDIFTSISDTIVTVNHLSTHTDADILREIGSGHLLRNMKELVCYAEGKAILDMIQARILRKTSDEGQERTSWRFSCYTSVPPESPEADLLKHLCLTHGIEVDITGGETPWTWVIKSGLMDDLPGYPFPNFE